MRAYRVVAVLCCRHATLLNVILRDICTRKEHFCEGSCLGYCAYCHRHLRSAARGDLAVTATRTVRYGPCSFAVAGTSVWNSFSTAT